MTNRDRGENKTFIMRLNHRRRDLWTPRGSEHATVWFSRRCDSFAASWRATRSLYALRNRGKQKKKKKKPCPLDPLARPASTQGRASTRQKLKSRLLGTGRFSRLKLPPFTFSRSDRRAEQTKEFWKRVWIRRGVYSRSYDDRTCNIYLFRFTVRDAPVCYEQL